MGMELIKKQKEWADAAAAIWKQDIHAEGDEDVITTFFDKCDWQWALNQTTNNGKYSEEARREHPQLLNWCGIFVAAAGLKVGLAKPVAKHIMPSTHRLQSDKRWKNAKLEPFDTVKCCEIRRGDILSLGTHSPPKPYGDHIVIVSDVYGSTARTIEGNTYGYLRHGAYTRGVVQRDRKFDLIKEAYRPKLLHFEE